MIEKPILTSDIRKKMFRGSFNAWIGERGNVNSGSFDPFEEICEKAVKAKAWIHFDGAFGLWPA
jgi:glutamate/tyrosine decarboxylase-like PLP-dependent enzyme